jgi:serine protease Do
VFAQTITPDLAKGLRLSREWGVVLGDVYPNSPAAKAGLRINDVILSVEGKPMENGRQFDVTIYQRPIGEPVNIEVGRGLQRLTLRVMVAERQDDADRFRDMVTPEQNLISRLGILALEVTPELASVIPGLRASHGVVVAGVALATEEMAGPLPGDVIHAVNGVSVRTIADLRTAIGQVAPDSVAVLQVGREGRLRFITVTLE